MTEGRIDHAAEAWKLIEQYAKANTLSTELVSGMMQAHATLALVEQQKLANLIAWTTANGFQPDAEIEARIDKELGLS